MGLIKEPRNIDFSGKSEPWTVEELNEFRLLMTEIKAKPSNREKVSKYTNSEFSDETHSMVNDEPANKQ